MEGNGHFRISKLLKMIMLRRVRHTAISRFGSSFLSDKDLYVSTISGRWHCLRWLERSTKLVRPKRKVQNGDGSLHVVGGGYSTK